MRKLNRGTDLDLRRLVTSGSGEYSTEALLIERLRRRGALRRRLEGYTLSAGFHVLLLLVLATITISAGGEGLGFNIRAKGAKVKLTLQE